MKKGIQILFLVITIFLGSAFIYPEYSYAGTKTEKSAEAVLDKEKKGHFSELIDEYSKYVVQYYYLDFDLDELKKNTLKKLNNNSSDADCLHIYFSLLDPWSAYFTSEEFEDFEESMSGEFCGIGAVVSLSKKPAGLLVERTYKNSPAEIAGIKAGDIIIKADDTDITGMSINEAVKLLRGEKGTQVRISVKRKNPNGKYKKYSFKLTRDKFTVNTVISKYYSSKKTGYIKVTEFDDNTDEIFDKAVTELTNKNMKSLILDLRDNPGGDANTAVNMAGRLLPANTLVTYFMSAYGEREDFYTPLTDGTSGKDEKITVPLIILINKNSASASELFTGCLLDDYSYSISTIGTKSYGKGVAQSFKIADSPDSKDYAVIKLTSAGYFTPSGKSIHKKGITPEQVVKNSTKAGAEDKQLKAALKTAVQYQN